MGLTAERFSQGMSIQDYMAQIRVNKAPFQEIFRSVQVPQPTREFFDRLPQPLRLAVFTADWCGDALSTTPAILRLAEASPTLQVRVWRSDDEPDLTNSFLPEHRHSTVPVFVVLTRDMAEVARFIETARSLVPHIEAMHQEIARQASAQGGEGARAAAGGRRTAFRVARAREWGEIILREFQEVVAQGLALPPSQRPAEGGTQWPPPEA